MTYATQSLTQTAGAGWNVPAASSGKNPVQDTGTSFQTLLRQACSTHNGTDTDPTQTSAEDTQPQKEDTKEQKTITVDLMALGAAMLAGGISQSQPETTCTAAGAQMQTVQAAGELTAAGADIGVTAGTADAAAPALSDQTAVSQTAQPATDTVQAVPAAKTTAPAVQTPEEGTAQQNSSAETGDGTLAASRSRQDGQSDRREDVQVTDRAGTWQAPLFRQTEQMPVKVGESVTVDTAAPPAQLEQSLGKALERGLENGEQHLEIRLSPEHLGTVTAAFDRTSEGTLHVVLRAENPEAAKLLEDHAGALGLLLQDGNHGQVRVEVPQPRQDQQSWQQQNQEGGRQQQQQQQRHAPQQDTEAFLHQLRLGLVDTGTEEIM